MQLSKNSWHAKLNDIIYDYHDWDNLCRYFWSTILACIIGIFVLPVYPVYKKLDKWCNDRFILGVFAFCWGLFLIPLVISIISWSYIPMMFSIILLGVIGAIFGSFALMSYIADHKPFRNIDDKPKKPNIVKEYIKAKKGKYCPRIDWKEEEKD